MIKGKSYTITLTFCEIASLEKHLDYTLEVLANGASYSASAHGVTMYCISENQAENVWDAVIKATDIEIEVCPDCKIGHIGEDKECSSCGFYIG